MIHGLIRVIVVIAHDAVRIEAPPEDLLIPLLQAGNRLRVAGQAGLGRLAARFSRKLAAATAAARAGSGTWVRAGARSLAGPRARADAAAARAPARPYACAALARVATSGARPAACHLNPVARATRTASLAAASRGIAPRGRACGIAKGNPFEAGPGLGDPSAGAGAQSAAGPIPGALSAPGSRELAGRPAS